MKMIRFLIGYLSMLAFLNVSLDWHHTLAAKEPPATRFTGDSAAAFQALLDQALEGADVVCEQAQPLVVSHSLTIRKPLTLRGLKASLPEKLGQTPILIVEALNVTLTDIEMHGNYQSVKQADRAPLIHLKRGGFRIERCRFYDGSKDGIMVTPDDGTDDIVGGVIRDIEGHRMGRDLVSLSGGCGGQRICDVTVENVRLKTGYFRGAVEVSDGTDHITVRRVYAEDAVYALDVQDHGAMQSGKTKPSAPNTNVTIEEVEAVNCKHLIRTANHALGHTNLTLRGFTARECQLPVQISNTTHVRVENVVIINQSAKRSPIALRRDDDVEIRNITLRGFKPGVEAVLNQNSNRVKIEGLTVEPDRSANKE